MKTSIKVFIKVQRIVATISRVRSRISITFKCIFSGVDHLRFSWQKGNIIFLGKRKFELYRIYRKYHVSMYFLKRVIPHFPSKEKISYFRGKELSGKRNTIFLDNTRKIIFQCNFFLKDHLFRTFEKNIYIYISGYFF